MIAQEFYQAINAGDIDAAMALVASDVQCRGGCYINGKDSFRAYIMSDTINSNRFELSDLKADQDKVTYDWKVYSKEGLFLASGTEILHIKDGLIVLMEDIAQ
jgi:ketosteroid isomerase-like protein